MAGTIYSGTYTSGISLYNPATQRPVTVTGKITNASGQGIIGNADFAWTVNNKGTVESTGGLLSKGIQLLAGGTVNNLVAGSVSPGGVSGAALIAGYDDGVLIEFAPGTVNNLGEIEGTGANGKGVSFFDTGGRVVNGSATNPTALITGGGNAVNVNGGAGAVSNFGTIASTNSGNGVHFDDGGSVVNGSAASTAALISSAGGHTAVYITGGAGAVTNFGAIKGGSVGVFLGDGGRVVNGQSGSAAGLIVGATNNTVVIAGASGTVANFGIIQTLGTLANIALTDGGSVTNGAAGATGALITGTGTAIYINNAAGTVTNFGRALDTSATGGNAVVLEDGGSVANFGTLQNMCTNCAGVYLHAAGSVANDKGALISGENNGIGIRGTGVVTNAGNIKSVTADGVYLHDGGSVSNQSGGVIAGHNDGVYNRSFAITVVNSGLIESTGTADGVYLRGGGTVTNNAGATISGTAAGIALGARGGTVTNHGVIKGVIGFSGGTFNSGNNTLVNFGTVASTAGATGVAVHMGNSVGNKLLVVEKAAVFTGLVEGGGRGEIEFAAPGTAAMGANISGFDTVALANGGPDSLTLTNANFSGVDGRLTVIGGNAGNTVNASTVTTGQLTIDGGAGADTLTGSANGGTIFVFAASALTDADKITGSGGFNNELDLTTSGPVAVNGVSAVEIYRLANGGADMLTLTNANFVGAMGLKIVYGGNGGNTIDGSTLAAANGLDIYGGAGLDVLKGGAGNDVFVFTAAALTASDTVSGGGGGNELLMTSAGTIHANGVSAVETYVLADGLPNILTLSSGNFAGTGGTITVSGGNGGNTVALAAGLPAADRLVAYAGSGPDKLTGGAGNDVFYAGGSTVMTGKAGTNEFVFTGIGNNTIEDFATSTTNEIVFSNSGFHLGLAGASATPKPLPAGLFVPDATGTFTATSERFAYGTTTGKLFYSAAGTTASEHLVATLAGAPSLTASHLFFIT